MGGVNLLLNAGKMVVGKKARLFLLAWGIFLGKSYKTLHEKRLSSEYFCFGPDVSPFNPLLSTREIFLVNVVKCCF